MPEKPERKKVCPVCKGFAVRLCPWCKIEEKDAKGQVISSKAGQGCRACMGRSTFTCTTCEGRGYLEQDDYDFSGQDITPLG